MTATSQFDAFDIILVRPRNPLNVGAAARAMANFGFAHLIVVDPYEPVWQAATSAVDAERVLEAARVAGSLAEAVRGATLVLGTGSLNARRAEQDVASLPRLAPRVGQELAKGGRVALVFGPEKHGLTREDLSWCHTLVEIPTHPDQPSMNLGQAVAVCLYEIYSRLAELACQPGRSQFGEAQLTSEPLSSVESVADSGGLDRLAELVEKTMQAAGYSPRSMQQANRHDLRLLLRRLNLRTHDQRRLLGLFRRILYRLDR